VSAHRVLIVDDHPIVRAGVRSLIEGEADLVVCGEASDADEALRILDATRPELAILDIALPGDNGLALLRRMRERDGRLRIVVYSMHDEALYAEHALAAGALGYVSKSAASTDVVSALRAALADRVFLSESARDRVLDTLHGKARGRSGVRGLSKRELEILDLLGQGLSTKEIAARLDVSIKTVETHRERIKGKLGLADGRQLLVRAVEWRFSGTS
jgi:DNA-binding NarL/FixJ family response regulator